MWAKEKISKVGDRLNKFPIMQKRKKWEIWQNLDGKRKNLQNSKMKERRDWSAGKSHIQRGWSFPRLAEISESPDLGSEVYSKQDSKRIPDP